MNALTLADTLADTHAADTQVVVRAGTGTPAVSFVVLSWNSASCIGACLDSIIAACSAEGLGYEIVVVDNGSADDSVSILRDYRRRLPSHIRRFLLMRNLGTTYPRNLALRRVTGDVVCVIDSDAELVNGRLSDVIRFLWERREVGILAPRLVMPDGRVQHSVKKFPTLWHKLLKLRKVFLSRGDRDPDFYPGFPFEELTAVESAIGACWFFRREILESVGYLDERIFYAPEDLDFCLRVWQSGHVILYTPSFTVLHRTQQITHRHPFSRISMSHLAGLLYYFSKHGGWFTRRAVAAFALRASAPEARHATVAFN
jgi:hypothetical protein